MHQGILAKVRVGRETMKGDAPRGGGYPGTGDDCMAESVGTKIPRSSCDVFNKNVSFIVIEAEILKGCPRCDRRTRLHRWKLMVRDGKVARLVRSDGMPVYIRLQGGDGR